MGCCYFDCDRMVITLRKEFCQTSSEMLLHAPVDHGLTQVNFALSSRCIPVFEKHDLLLEFCDRIKRQIWVTLVRCPRRGPLVEEGSILRIDAWGGGKGGVKEGEEEVLMDGW